VALKKEKYVKMLNHPAHQNLLDGAAPVAPSQLAPEPNTTLIEKYYTLQYY
jgi:hypothetical protein